MAGNDATIDLRLLTKKFIKDTKSVEKVMLGFRNKMNQVASAARKMLLIGGGAIAGFIKLASDFQENFSKFNAVFKENSKEVAEWAKTYSASVNRSRADTLKFLASLQDTFVPLGFARDKAAELSKQVVQLATDLASFNNESDSEVVASLTSALVGNTEAVRKYGIVLNQATIESRLLANGISGGVKAATQAEKAFAILNIIMASTKDAQGDAARTSGSFANQLKGMLAAAKDLGIELGNVFLPSVTKLIASIKASIPGMIEWVKVNGDAILSFTILAAKVGAGAIVIEKAANVIAPLAILAVTIAANWSALIPIFAAVAKAVAGMAVVFAAFLPIILLLVAAIQDARNKIGTLDKALKRSVATTEASVASWKKLTKATRDFDAANDPKKKEAAAKTKVNALKELTELREKELRALEKSERADAIPEQVFENQRREIEQLNVAMEKAIKIRDRATERRRHSERTVRPGRSIAEAEPLSEEMVKLGTEVDAILESLRMQRETFGLSNDEIVIWELREKGISGEKLKQVQRAQALLNKQKEHNKLLDDAVSLKLAGLQADAESLRNIQDANAAEFELAKEEDERRKKRALADKVANIESLESAHRRILSTSAGRVNKSGAGVGTGAKRREEQKLKILSVMEGILKAIGGDLSGIQDKLPGSPVLP